MRLRGRHAGKGPRINRVKLVHLGGALAGDLARLWRRSFPCREMHAHVAWNPSGGSMTRRSIERRILSSEAFDPAGSFVAVVAGRVAGFCLAAARRARRPRDGYLCALAVEPRLRGQGIGTMLLGRAERYLARRGARRVLTSFEGNPMPLLLGVPPAGEAYPFLLNRGFRSSGRELLQVMAQDTARFRLRRPMRERIRRLEGRGVRIRRMEARDRRGLDRLLARHFPAWHRGIMAQVTSKPPAELLVAVRSPKVLGFAGPFSVGAEGAGHFFALGVAPAERGKGFGAALFHRMCAQLKAGGARIVHLTTSLDNSAQEIYARAGFRTRCVADTGMRKDLGRERGRRKR